MGLQQALGIRQQGVACRRQPHWRAAALQQLHLQLFFQFLDMRGHIRLHGVQPLCGSTKTASAVHRFKHAQRFQLHGPCQSQKKMNDFILNHWT